MFPSTCGGYADGLDDARSSPATPSTRNPSRRAAALAVAALVALSLALRWFGLGCQLPQFVPVDSLVLASEVEVLRHHGDPSYRLWPNLYPRLIPELVRLLPTETPDDPPPRTLEEHLARARAPYVRVGIVVALLSVLLVPGTYLLARRFLERAWSLLAAALAATSVLFLWFSQQGRPHGAATSVILLAVLAALRLRRRPTFSSYVLAGIALGAAIGTLQSGVAALLPFAAAFLLRKKDQGLELASVRGSDLPPDEPSGPEPRIDGASFASPWFVALSLAIVGLLAFALYPSMKGTPAFRGEPPGPAFALHGSLVTLMGHAISLTNFNGDGFALLARALWSYDPLIAATFALGAVVLLVALVGLWTRRSSRARSAVASSDTRRDLLVVLAFAVPYAAAIGLYHFSGQRFLLPLLPYIACVAAFGLRALWKLAQPRGVALRSAAAALVAAILAVQAFGAMKLSRIRSRPDTATEAATWLREHLPSKSDLVLLGPGFDLPLLLTPDALARNEERPNLSQRWYTYQVAAAKTAETKSASRSTDSQSTPSSSSRDSSESRSSTADATNTADRYELLTIPVTTDEDKRKLLHDPAAYVRELGASWVVIEARRTWEWRGVEKLREALPQVGELAARFEPDDAERYADAPIAHQGFDPLPFPIPWFRRILGARCTGSVLEIWRIRR
jgi:hypothetical protein